jgi:hypothetical protein
MKPVEDLAVPLFAELFMADQLARARLGKHAIGKSCLYINKLADVDLIVLEAMIREDWSEMKQRYPD